MEEQFCITRIVEFSAAHRLYREDWTAEQNWEVFGKCSYPYGHGHNYVLEVALVGKVNAESQMVLHFSSLERILAEMVVAPLDHRHLNHDVDFLKDLLPTSENIVRALWDRLAAVAWPAGVALSRLKLSSTAKNSVQYDGPSKAGIR